MDLLTSLWTRYREKLHKLFRYSAVSVVSTVTSLTVLGIMVGLMNLPPGRSNIVATCLATIPSFELNRRWVWSRQGQRSLFKEMLPFWGLSLLGLAWSTINVALVGVWTQHWSHLGRAAAAGATNVGTFGLLWIFQFVLCDRWLFKDRSAARAGALGDELLEPEDLTAELTEELPAGPAH
ncbi:MAG TPA: GtrA family protein [Actinomycetota bacterium]|nr:GtrA family protein [Actinomycetota bacterium]